MPRTTFVQALASSLLFAGSSALTLEAHLHFPESGLDTAEYKEAAGDDTLFGVNFVSCFNAATYGGSGCPGAEGVFSSSARITAANKAGTDLWVLPIPIDHYSGPVYIDVYAPQAFAPTDTGIYKSSVPDCTTPEARCV